MRLYNTTGSSDSRLHQIINMKHELVQLVGKIDWDWIDGKIAPLYSENIPALRPVYDRAAVARAHLRPCPMRVCASAGSTTRTSSTSPAKSSFSTRSREGART